jgi:hypothetical protein
MDESTSRPTPTGPRHWLDEPRNVRLLWRGFLGVLVLAVLAEFVVHLHPVFAIEAVFGFSAWFGLLACLVMIVAAKALALILKRPDTYYADGEGDDA